MYKDDLVKERQIGGSYQLASPLIASTIGLYSPPTPAWMNLDFKDCSNKIKLIKTTNYLRVTKL